MFPFDNFNFYFRQPTTVKNSFDIRTHVSWTTNKNSVFGTTDPPLKHPNNFENIKSKFKFDLSFEYFLIFK